MWRIWLVLGLAGCRLGDDLVRCEDGRACPIGLLCDELHHTCITNEQLSACTGAENFTSCTTTTLGGACFDGVCLPAGCGNGVAEPDERCDDGNTVGLDGCAADCTSEETCGNGVRDAWEVCDDGNFVSHDGCSSRCEEEVVTWQAFPLSTLGGSPTRSVFDRARGRLVFVAGRTIWEWTGAEWIIASMAFEPSLAVASYDSDRERVVFFDNTKIADWDGVSLETRSETGGRPDGIVLAVYDPARKRTLVLGGLSNTSATYNATTGTWTPAPTPFTITYWAQGAYDAARDRIVVLLGDGVTWEWNGTGWQSVATAPPMPRNAALVYDVAGARLLAIGGQPSSGTGGESGAVLRWTGSAWNATGATIPARFAATAWYAPSSGGVFVHGGFTETTHFVDMWEITGTSSIDRSPPMPHDPGPLVYDPANDRLMMFDSNAAWTWNAGAWIQIAAVSQPASLADVVFDPARGVIGIDYNRGTLRFTQDWELLPVGSTPPIPNRTLSYDPMTRRVIAVEQSMTYALGGADVAWQPIGPGIYAETAAFDVELGTMTAHRNGPGGRLYDLVDSEWVGTLTPLGYFHALEAPPTKGVLMLPSGSDTPIWQRRNGTWRALERPPLATLDAATMSFGHIAIAAASAGTNVLLVMQLRSTSTADESCIAGNDDDGDGTAGCEDPDCWWKCHPACPYASVCP